MIKSVLIAFTMVLFAIVGTSAQEARWQAEGWSTDFSKKSVGFNEVMSGGPPKDGIPPIDSPKFITVDESKDLSDVEPVIGLEINGDARAYPLRIMTWHEIVNDVVGGSPVAVTYCPLCNAAIVFDARVDGKTLSFGTTGKLRNSDLIMYDRSTESWWQQFVGEGIVGTYTGKKLKLVPARLESWKNFKSRFPQGKVLVPNDDGMRDYGRNPYTNYDVSQSPFLYHGSMPEGISPMARVVIVKNEGQDPLIVAQQMVRDQGSLTIAGVKIGWEAGQSSALHDSTIAKGRDVGNIIVQDAKSGNDLPYDVTFAFVAHAFHPEIAIKK